MRHQQAGRKLSRKHNHRKSLIKTLTCQFIQQDGIETTLAKAKEIRPVVEKVITKGRDASLSTRRELLKRLGSKTAVDKLLQEISPKYAQCPGGYTSIIKKERRRGDCAPMAIITYKKEEEKDVKQQ